jgi:hypothetical protein
MVILLGIDESEGGRSALTECNLGGVTLVQREIKFDKNKQGRWGKEK